MPTPVNPHNGNSDAAKRPIGRTRLRFGTLYPLYLMGVTAASLALFDVIAGVIVAVVTAAVSLLALQHSEARKSVMRFLLLVAGAVALVANYVVSHPDHRGVWGRRNSSLQNLKYQSLALLGLEQVRGCFPPAHTKASNGDRLHSWRVPILPHLDEEGLYSTIARDKPWNTRENLAALESTEIWSLSSLRRPAISEDPTQTNYMTINSPECVMRSDGVAVRLEDITDGPSRTIILMEVGPRNARWYEPKDLDLEEAIDLLVGSPQDNGHYVRDGFFISTRLRGDGLWPRLVAFADGRSEEIGYFKTREAARAYLTYHGGEAVGDLDEVTEPVPDVPSPELVVGYIYHYDRIALVAVLATLTVLPFFEGPRRRLFGPPPTQHVGQAVSDATEQS